MNRICCWGPILAGLVRYSPVLLNHWRRERVGVSWAKRRKAARDRRRSGQDAGLITHVRCWSVQRSLRSVRLTFSLFITYSRKAKWTQELQLTFKHQGSVANPDGFHVTAADAKTSLPSQRRKFTKPDDYDDRREAGGIRRGHGRAGVPKRHSLGKDYKPTPNCLAGQNGHKKPKSESSTPSKRWPIE